MAEAKSSAWPTRAGGVVVLQKNSLLASHPDASTARFPARVSRGPLTAV